MSSGTLYRWSGVVLLIGGLVGVVGAVLVTLLFPGHNHTPQEVLSGSWPWVEGLLFVGFVLSTLGVPGLYLRQAARAGGLGNASMYSVHRTMYSLLLTFQSHEGRRLPVSLDEGGINMAKVQDMPKEMEKKPSPARSTLHKVAILALLGNSLAYFYILLSALIASHHIIPPLLILGTLTLLGTALSCLRFRWAPAVGALVALGAVSFTMSIPPPQYIITHPSDAASFIPLLALLSFGLVGIVAGIAATLQDYRSPGAPAPRTLRLLLTSFTTFVVGMMVVSLIVAANPPTSTASTTTNGEPTVHMSANAFVQNVVLVPKGSRLRLVDDVNNEQHVLRNGFWKADGSPESSVEPGAPVVKDVTVNSGSIEIGPFATAGVFHLYCTIHQGMNLTIVVQ